MATTALITATERDWARAARAAHPLMTPYGFTAGPDNQWAAELSDEHLDEIAIACRWLQALEWRSTADSSCIGSYAAKHQAENWARRQGFERSYVREGALLLAAVTLGVPLKRYGHWGSRWGAYLGLSRRSLKAIALATPDL